MFTLIKSSFLSRKLPFLPRGLFKQNSVTLANKSPEQGDKNTTTLGGQENGCGHHCLRIMLMHVVRTAFHLWHLTFSPGQSIWNKDNGFWICDREAGFENGQRGRCTTVITLWSTQKHTNDLHLPLVQELPWKSQWVSFLLWPMSHGFYVNKTITGFIFLSTPTLTFGLTWPVCFRYAISLCREPVLVQLTNTTVNLD